MEILAPRQWSLREKVESQKHKGRPSGKLAGVWNDDLTATRNLVLLCHSCRGKFNARKAGYRQARTLSCFGRCDGCRIETTTTAFFAEESFNRIFQSPAARGRRTL